MHHLSSTDAAFLHVETPETPMHVGSLMLFAWPEGDTGQLEFGLTACRRVLSQAESKEPVEHLVWALQEIRTLAPAPADPAPAAAPAQPDAVRAIASPARAGRTRQAGTAEASPKPDREAATPARRAIRKAA